MSKRKSAKVEAPKGKNHGRKRVQLMNGKGQRRMIWLDEYNK